MDMSDQFFSNLETMAEECDERGLISTISGDLNEKVAIYGIFHCVRGSNGTVTFTYVINTLSTQIKRKLQSKCIFFLASRKAPPMGLKKWLIT